ncbi:hypothetical protein [Nocardia brasiliensis]|uniref:hypothetical protein n=1 Tax=Nocardia brasiliensis TaxID=37326 RepID=UPI000A9351A8|nr:hypothetical protein [Nocardia brasiliensis]
MATPAATPAPAPGVFRPLPLPPDLAAARAAGRRVGIAYGEFAAWEKYFLGLFAEGGVVQGVALWDRLPPERRLEAIALVKNAYDSLPKLPPSTSIAMARVLRQGFEEGAKAGYEAELFATRAVWVACELAKAYATAKASTPVPYHVGASINLTRDCTSHTAARAILEMTGVEVPVDRLVRNFGVPKVSIASYRDAVSYARNWFERVGIRLGAKPVDLLQAIQRRAVGRYVVFFQGEGHVVFAEITATETRIIDDQAGKMWHTIIEAQNYLKEPIGAANRIESIVLPF